MNKPRFWKGKAVLVTGASGFIGSHLTDALVEQGAEVSVFVRKKKAKHFGNLSESGGRIKNFLQDDIAGKGAIKAIKRNNPAIIFHLAADAHVNYSFEHPMQVMRTNLLGTLNVLHAAMQLGGIQQVVCTSSCQVYGSAAEGKIDESYPLNPESPYAASKAAADRYCYAYWKAYGLPIAIIRPFNSFGPRAEHDVITKFINLALRNQPITINGNGEQSRDFTFVSDMAKAFLLMGGSRDAVGKAINFGSGKGYSVNFIAQKIKSLSGSKSGIMHVKHGLPDVQRQLCNCGLAKKMFGWQPSVAIEEGLQRTIDWAKGQKGI